MAKTFKTIYGDTIEIVDRETSVDTNEDIETGDISNYFVVVYDTKYEVSEKVYSAVQNYIR